MPVSVDAISMVLEDIIFDFLSMEVTDAPAELAGEIWSGVIQLTGGWETTLVVAYEHALASQIATIMFSLESGTEPSQEEIQDAVGEFVNIVAGHVRKMRPDLYGGLTPPLVSSGSGPGSHYGGVERTVSCTVGCSGAPIEVALYRREAYAAEAC